MKHHEVRLRPSSPQVLLFLVPMPSPTQLLPACSQLPRILAPPATISLELTTSALSNGTLGPSIRRNLAAGGQKPLCSGREISRCSRRPSGLLQRLTPACALYPFGQRTARCHATTHKQANRYENHARGPLSLNLLIREVSYPLILAKKPALHTGPSIRITRTSVLALSGRTSFAQKRWEDRRTEMRMSC